jgi:hypothetical protein
MMNDKYNSFNSSNSSMEMSLSSLVGRVHRHGVSSSSPAPQHSPTISLGWSQQHRNQIDYLQDILGQALDIISDTPSLDSSDTLAPPRSHRNHQNRSGNSAYPDDPGHSHATSQ